MSVVTANGANVMNDYSPGDIFYVLMKPEDIPFLVETWIYYDYLQGDLIIRRSKKNKGMLVLETKSVMFAYKALREHHGVKISIKKEDGTLVNG